MNNREKWLKLEEDCINSSDFFPASGFFSFIFGCVLGQLAKGNFSERYSQHLVDLTKTFLGKLFLNLFTNGGVYPWHLFFISF